MGNKTAVQEFSEWLLAFEYELPLELQVKAKECLVREKEQIKDAFNAGRTWNNSWNAEEYFKNLSISNQLNDFLNGK